NTVDSTFKNKEWDSRAEAVFGEMGWLSGAALGVQAGHRDFSALGDAADFLLPTRSSSLAGFAFAEAPLASVANLPGAVRYENVETHGNPFGVSSKGTFDLVSGSLGVLFDLSRSVKFGLTASSAARAPALVELYADGPHDGPHTFETGDPDLKLERANSL